MKLSFMDKIRNDAIIRAQKDAESQGAELDEE